MRTVPRHRVEIIRLTHPAARTEMRDGHECVVIPTYDIETDRSGEHVVRLVDDDRPRPRVGETRIDQHGNAFKIVDPPGGE